jgi:hypothetical protein
MKSDNFLKKYDLFSDISLIDMTHKGSDLNFLSEIISQNMIKKIKMEKKSVFLRFCWNSEAALTHVIYAGRAV